jgi:hypothetical protein
LTRRLAEIAARLGLSDDELLTIFKLDPLAAIGGDYDHLPQVEVLDGLTAQAAELAGQGSIARWVRSSGESPGPIELLEHGDWAGFEDALDRWLCDSGIAPG